MSVSGISASNFFNYITQSSQTNTQQFRKQFLQLGQDLQSGNLSAAQSDFAQLQGLNPQTSSTSGTQSSSSISQEFNQLSTDLQSGNLSGAQQDYNNLRQQEYNSGGAAGTHHHHHGGGGPSVFSAALQQLGQALQSGNLSGAQQAYTTLEQQFQQFMEGSGTTSAGVQPNAVNLSATA